MALNKLTSFGSIQHTDDIYNLLTFLHFSPKLPLLIYNFGEMALYPSSKSITFYTQELQNA